MNYQGITFENGETSYGRWLEKRRIEKLQKQRTEQLIHEATVTLRLLMRRRDCHCGRSGCVTCNEHEAFNILMQKFEALQEVTT